MISAAMGASASRVRPCCTRSAVSAHTSALAMFARVMVATPLVSNRKMEPRCATAEIAETAEMASISVGNVTRALADGKDTAWGCIVR